MNRKKMGIIFFVLLVSIAFALPGSCFAAGGEKLWQFETGSAVRSSPAVSGTGRFVYVGGYDKKVYCIDAYDEREEWQFETGGFVDSSPAVSDGYVYAGSDDRKVYCLDAKTGEKVWEFETGGPVRSSPAVSDGYLYVGSRDSKVYCLDTKTGEKVWQFETGGFVDSSPAISDGYVYVGSDSHKLYCLNAQTGERLWDFETGGKIKSSPAVDRDGRVYVGSDDGGIHCIHQGSLLWKIQTGDKVISSPAVSGGYIYVGSLNNKVYCLIGATGLKVWEFETGGDVQSSPAISGGYVYVGSLDNKVYCLDAKNGRKIWEYETSSWVHSSPAVDRHYGHVYVGSCDHKLYCLAPAEGDQGSWPMFKYDSERTGETRFAIEVTPVWEFQTEGYMKIDTAPAVSWWGYVYVSSYNDKLYCLNAKTGEKVWEFEARTNKWVTPTVTRDLNVYIGSLDGKVYCLDGLTGEVKWYFETRKTILWSPAVSGGYAYVVVGERPNESIIYCLDAHTGSIVWNRSRTPPFSIVASGEYLYVDDARTKLYCLNAMTGDEVWQFEGSQHGGGFDYSAITEDYVYTSDLFGKMYCVDAKTGEKRWEKKITGEICDPVVDPRGIATGGIVFVGGSDGKVRSLWEYGEQRWEFRTGGKVSSSPAVSTFVYVGSKDHKVYCLDPYDGSKLWEFDTGDEVISSPAISEGYVYVGSSKRNGNKGKVFCLRAAKGDNGTWPMWRHDPGYTGAAGPLDTDGEDDEGDKEGICVTTRAAHGSPLAEELDVLRSFRDRYLVTNPVGKALVDIYYRYSPPVANYLGRHETLRTATRWALTPVVYGIKYSGNLLLIIFLSAVVTFTHRKLRKRSEVPR